MVLVVRKGSWTGGGGQDTQVPYPHNEPIHSLCVRGCHGIQHPSCGIPLCLPGHWGESAPWHCPVCWHCGEVSAGGLIQGALSASPHPRPGSPLLPCRYRQTWWTSGQETTKPEGEGQHMLVPLGLPVPTFSDTPLLSHPAPSAPGMLHMTHADFSSSGQ